MSSNCQRELNGSSEAQMNFGFNSNEETNLNQYDFSERLKLLLSRSTPTKDKLDEDKSSSGCLREETKLNPSDKGGYATERRITKSQSRSDMKKDSRSQSREVVVNVRNP